MKVAITPRANEDLISIACYTYDTWGERQMQTYMRAINARFEWLSENYRLGRQDERLDPAYFYVREGQHLIFYEVIGDAIFIIGIPHAAMDIPRYLGQE